MGRNLTGEIVTRQLEGRISGQVMKQELVQGREARLSLAELTPGMYWMVLRDTATGRTATSRMVRF
ncbi:MAG TPA: hypothetical protein DCR93_24650 [Cytophagales bacterium]|nr:hypothetical protein [Cytophagales bacterium]HAP62550.1 hypothetical protein [Cytophagales bacterium]